MTREMVATETPASFASSRIFTSALLSSLFFSVTYFVVTRKLYFIYTCEQGAQQIRSLVNEVVGGKCSQNTNVAPVSGCKAATFDPCLQTRV